MLLWPFNKYPGTDYETFNWEWLINIGKQMQNDAALILQRMLAAKEAAEAASGSASDAAASSAESEHQAELAGNSATASANSAASIAGLKSQIQTNTNRIDNLIANAGDTDNNAELLDIRIAENGETYETAGDAVRAQAYTNITYTDASINRFNGDVTPGYVNQSNGDFVAGSTTYEGTTDYIKISSPFVIGKLNYAGANIGLRYAVYDEDKNYLAGEIVSYLTQTQNPAAPDASIGQQIISVPNAKYVRFSMVTGAPNSPTQPTFIVNGSSLAMYTRYTGDPERVMANSLRKNESITTEIGNLINGTTLKIPFNSSVRKNKLYKFFGTFSAFDTLYCGHGEIGYGLYFKIDSNNVTFISNGVEGSSIAHGLTFDTYISVSLQVGQLNEGTLTIDTLNGHFERTVQIVNGYRGEVFIRPESFLLSNCKITVTYQDVSAKSWLFGDSYFTHTSPSRWPYHLINAGYDKFLLNAFPGEQSTESRHQLEHLLEWHGSPKLVGWCMGMNNPDEGAVNNNWLINVQAVISLCEQRGIEPVLATIPCTPNVDNTYKNAWVKASGYRYIDFAKAVNAETAGSTWYTGCLSSDNTHPTEEGAKLLAIRAMLDMPELTD